MATSVKQPAVRGMASLKERVRMALAEAGYPDADVHGPDDEPAVALSGPNGVPDEACWKAFAVARCEFQPCFKCWMAGREDECSAVGLGQKECA